LRPAAEEETARGAGGAAWPGMIAQAQRAGSLFHEFWRLEPSFTYNLFSAEGHRISGQSGNSEGGTDLKEEQK
jgi:hypothetical protein